MELHITRCSLDITFKAETHNHPTGISPFPGAATGAGGEGNDESATGRGGYLAGLWFRCLRSKIHR